MQITQNFTLTEMVKSQAAINARIGNMPDKEQLANIILLCKHVLQPLRDAIGVVNVNSGFRSVALNQLIGGAHKIVDGQYVPTSQHCKGQAADITCNDNSSAFNFIRQNLQFDQLIWEFGNDNSPAWIHVSYSENFNRKQVLRAFSVNGRTVYEPA